MACFEFNNRYEETKTMLQRMINQGLLSGLEVHIEQDPSYQCYFCKKKIEGKMFQLTLKYELRGKQVMQHFYLDPLCYQISKTFHGQQGTIN